MNGKVVAVLATVVLLLLLASSSLYVVNETQRAILLEFKKVKDADLKPGLGFKWPIINEVIKFDGRVQVLDSAAEEFLTLEKKRLIVDSYVTWIISDVQKYFTATGGLSRNAQQLLADRVNNGLRDKFGRRTVHEVISGEREELMVTLTKEVNEFSVGAYGVRVVDIRVKQINLPTAASDAVYARMRAERDREAQEYRATGKELAEGIRADADRQQRILRAEAYRDAEKIRGEGDALATATYAEAFNQNAEFYEFYRSLEAYRSAFGGKEDILVIKPDSEFFKYLNKSRPAN